MTGIHRKNPDLSICVPGYYITAAPLDNNWEETVAHSAEERDRGNDGERHRGGNARKPLTIWHILHMPSHRFKRSAGGQTQTDASGVNGKSGLNKSDQGWICWRTAAYCMTVLCSAGCFCCYDRCNDTQWTGAAACGIRLQLNEWITAARMNPNSSSLFHNLKISWGFGVSGKPNLALFISVILVFFLLTLLQGSDSTFSAQDLAHLSKINWVWWPQQLTKTQWKQVEEKEVGVGYPASREPSFPLQLKRKSDAAPCQPAPAALIVVGLIEAHPKAPSPWLHTSAMPAESQVGGMHRSTWAKAQMLFPKYTLMLITFR